jgi:simple sugar transport system ATP-binding protein
MQGIVKTFGPLPANRKVDFDLLAGEVHALLGENGAGKSTLMNVLAGVYRKDEGVIRVAGREVDFHSPRQALDAGIGMVHQHFRLIPTLTVAENVILGLPGPLRLPDPEALHAEILALSQRYRLPIDPAARVYQLSVGEQQRVEILKLLHRRTSVLILDEPTAALTPPEADLLFDVLRVLREEGKGIVFISHKMQEVRAIADRITVLRGGKRVASCRVGEASPAELTRWMVGSEVGSGIQEMLPLVHPGAPAAKVTGLVVADDRGQRAVDGVTFEVRPGEILGIAGVAGNGQRELAEALTGMRRPLSGVIAIDGRNLAGGSPAAFIDAGVGFIPEDRHGTALVPGFTVAENILLRHPEWGAGPRGGILSTARMEAFALTIIDRFDIQPRDPRLPAGYLSGGNLQKIVVARELAARPSFLVAAYPMRGLDVRATAAVSEMLSAARGEGCGILLIGEDLEALFALCDRIGVLYAGRLAALKHVSDLDPQQVGLLMAGGGKGNIQ